MSLQWQSVMRDSISEILETMFFTVVDFEESARPPSVCDFVSGINLTSENEQVEISFGVTEEFGRMVTANFLGTDEGAVDIEDMEDSLKELANMVGGSFLAQSSDKNWRMGIPHVQRTCSGAERGGCPDAELAFSLFGDPVGAVSVRFGQIA